MKKLIFLALYFLSTSSFGQSSNFEWPTKKSNLVTVPTFWSCQYYQEWNKRKDIVNLGVSVVDNDGDGEFQLNVHLYQQKNGRIVKDDHLYNYAEDGITLYHRGHNFFSSARGTISLNVERRDSEFLSYTGTFTSNRFKIYKLKNLECTWNGQE
ncbi:hypothetical protein N9D31_02060 [Oligoflexaceae bacterium]|nr:hypothetical protein [Oligoflexaceae bacterium]